MKRLLIGVALLSLSGCGIAAKIQSRDDMMAAKSAYTDCLANNPQNPGACEGLRLAYQADLQAYDATSAGMRPGYTFSVINQ